MFPSISPDGYIYVQLVIAGLFVLSLVYISNITRDYIKIDERKKDDK